jgi:hypothetical protein
MPGKFGTIPEKLSPFPKNWHHSRKIVAIPEN